jgi:hypothetical protein
MEKLPAFDTPETPVGSVSSHAMSRLVETTQFLGVDVYELAGP